MNRVCVINVAALSGRLLAAAGELSINRLALRLRPLKPTLPAVTCSVQASLTTGVPPAVHGIIANGLYFRECRTVSFWEQSNTLLSKKRFWHSRHLPACPRVAMIFWQNSMAGAADVVVTPKPRHSEDGKTVSWCFSQPTGLYDRLIDELGPFDLMSYWGPMASVKSSQWITACALHVWKTERPDLQLVYLPHLDYGTQKWGPDDPRVAQEVRVADELVGQIIQAVQADGGQAVVLSEYGMVPVRRAVLPNVLLRQAGLLAVRQEGGAELLDLENTRAFAMADHQVAHVYCADRTAIEAVAEILSSADGVGRVLEGSDIEHAGLHHSRSGDVIALASPDAWFAYYWWTDPATAPPFAHTVDIHRKPGYDPCELFLDPANRRIPTEPSLVKGSHGLVNVAPADQAILAATCDLPGADNPVATDLPEMLKAVMFGSPLPRGRG